MDESQSSDFFSETEISYNSVIVESVPYDTLIRNTKIALSSSNREIKKPTFSVYFTTLLEDCQSCISQSLTRANPRAKASYKYKQNLPILKICSHKYARFKELKPEHSQALDLIISILSDTDVQVTKVLQYISDAVLLLQMLSNFTKTVIESVSMVCQSMKIFPTATGDIIFKVFMHCKDSEFLYGPNLSNVEKELKDLFRTCHELQLTYLMIMEKHFVFDLTERDDVEVLTDALDINLKIGDIVQTLDVKTMAEQWKAFAAICEKYSNSLMDKSVYNNSVGILSEMIEHNIKSALERDQEDKVILRSLKVTSFSIKILLKVCGIFKHATLKNHQVVFDLLLYIYSNNSAVLEIYSDKTAQFLSLVNTNVSHPTELLLKELLFDVKFYNYILDFDVSKLQSEDKVVGYILIVISTIKSTLQRDDNRRHPKHTFIRAIYTLLEHCHPYTSIGLRFLTEVKSTYETQGLYENLLTNFVAFATTLSADEFAVLERTMIDSILGSDCMAALFSSNTWSLLARIITPQLLLSQLTRLCMLYQKLEKIKLFSHSPQKVSLSYTIRCLFEAMHEEEKLKIFNLFYINNEKNYNLWSALQIKNLPDDLQRDINDILTEKLKTQFRKICAGADIDEVEKMVNLFKLISTCSTVNNNVVDCILKAWVKACPKSNSATMRDLNKETLWYYNYVDTLVSITVENGHSLRSDDVIKILHVIAEIVKTRNIELKLVIVNIVCHIIDFDIQDTNKYAIESLLIQIIKHMSQDSQNIVKFKLYSSLREYKGSLNLNRIISLITKEDPLKDTWDCFVKHGVLGKNNKWRDQLLASDYKFCHKCIIADIFESKADNLKKTCSGNFELDIDSLFENESDNEQPVHKKVKLNHNEADAIISRLENDVCLLCKQKENVLTSEQKTKIRSLCDGLRNICD